MTEASKKVIFLDRDGPINVDHGFVHKVEDWEWSPGVFEGLKKLQSAGYLLVIITNQSGIGHSLYRDEDMHKLHDYMKAELAKKGIRLDGVFYCPHDRNSTCDCRKPNTGMAKQAEQLLGGIDYASSWTIGDKMADQGFGKKVGTKNILLRSRYWQEKDLSEYPEFIVNNLNEAADKILS